MSGAENGAAPAARSAAAPSPFPPIADYAFLSDCHTGALIAPDGAVDWLCVPAFDSPSVFGTLLDRGAGTFRVGPFGINVPTARVVRARHERRRDDVEDPQRLDRGSGRADDRSAGTGRPRHPAHATAGRQRRRPPAGPDRRVPRGPRRDRARVRAGLRLRTDAGRVDPRRGEPARRRTRPAPARRSACTPTWPSGSRRTRFARDTTSIGATGSYSALSWGRDLAGPADVDDAVGRIETTVRIWRDWLGQARLPDHRWRDPIQRSALAIKGLTFAPTGATVAALTTSLPETPRGERNWDYRYSWMRDSTFTLQALHWLNLDWEAEEFIEFIADLEPNDDGAMQIMYGIDGRRDLTESTRDDLSGYDGARPVRIGNGAFDQRQNDVFGAVLDSILLHTRRSQRLPRRIWPVVQAQAACASDVWTRAGPGDLGGPRQAAALRLLEAHVLGGDGSRGEARGDPRRSRPRGRLAEDRRRDQDRHPRARRPGRCVAAALRDRLPRRVRPPRARVRVPPARRRTASAPPCWRSPRT